MISIVVKKSFNAISVDEKQVLMILYCTNAGREINKEFCQLFSQELIWYVKLGKKYC